MPSEGTARQTLRVNGAVWSAALVAFPADRGRPGGLSAELQGFVAFLAEDPDKWRAVKVEAERRGLTPWQLITEAIDRLAAE